MSYTSAKRCTTFNDALNRVTEELKKKSSAC